MELLLVVNKIQSTKRVIQREVKLLLFLSSPCKRAVTRLRKSLGHRIVGIRTIIPDVEVEEASGVTRSWKCRIECGRREDVVVTGHGLMIWNEFVGPWTAREIEGSYGVDFDNEDEIYSGVAGSALTWAFHCKHCVQGTTGKYLGGELCGWLKPGV
ncbi:hypothetical protein GOBAR_DD16686 [Gossypium barbadense]|nr:hypothetical protein GOBAR_DD16686 [Gossypium barbadense]